jgi:hypothetical protein
LPDTQRCAEEAAMTVPDDHTYPVIATNKAWQKKKSFTDKAKKATKTGLGALLTKAETEWAKINWMHLDLAEVGKIKGEVEAQDHLERAMRANNQQLRVQEHVKAAEKQAKLVAENNALSQPARTAATNIANQLKLARQRLKLINIQEFNNEVERQHDLDEQAAQRQYAYRTQLANVSVTTRKLNQEIITAPAALIKENGAVEITQATWHLRGQRQLDFVEAEVTVQATRTDNSNYANDMQIASMAMGGSKVTFR